MAEFTFKILNFTATRLLSVKQEGETLTDVVKRAFWLLLKVHAHAKDGYTEMFMRNPKTGEIFPIQMKNLKTGESIKLKEKTK